MQINVPLAAIPADHHGAGLAAAGDEAVEKLVLSVENGKRVDVMGRPSAVIKCFRNSEVRPGRNPSPDMDKEGDA